jgi:hypothetical protein
MTPEAIDRATDRCRQIGLPVTREGVATIARYLDEERAARCPAAMNARAERASCRQPDRLVGSDECVPVHVNGVTHVVA